ncbi:uncharacterized protein LOC116302851 isoform X2 [Actinia tenebrosa]|uniref:Uncharacterized protein LOC116302851 isoform X2 n=1 Tax=Actinia tenebrosa TaxID=6105 RepID=A0A6P8INM2_ACTTE|nr:uncharacterized protein LOC116302851 isoform X2 [Actinia tenebrosa]
MARLFFAVIFCVFLNAQETSSNKWTPTNETHVKSPRWNQLSVTWMKLFRLPLTTSQAKSGNWVQDTRCDNQNFFRGNRYTLRKDKSVMLLFDDSNSKIVGIQGEIPKKKVLRKSLPWIHDRGHYVITAYFRDPVSICSNNTSSTGILGDRLLIQNDSSAFDYVTIPLREQGLMGTKWVKGKCFWSMGQLYWYNISSRMACRDMFPVFLMYNNGELNGFGWIVLDDLDITTSTSFVRATSTSFQYFFQNGSMPECLKTAGHMSLQHIFLDDTPFLNFC